MMRALWKNQVIAESNDTVVVEGNHYFPLSSLKKEFTVPSDTKTTCPWKGEASYFSLKVGNAVNTDAAWYYPSPKKGAEAVADRVAFWRGVAVEG